MASIPTTYEGTEQQHSAFNAQRCLLQGNLTWLSVRKKSINWLYLSKDQSISLSPTEAIDRQTKPSPIIGGGFATVEFERKDINPIVYLCTKQETIILL
ncbi:hypothetical protein UB51_09230 [Paenibacillus sp. IHBB 10380]|nr:hypothetical protein UB51_09230 [Paenibacillus sp. IHBB 10380]